MSHRGTVKSRIVTLMWFVAAHENTFLLVLTKKQLRLPEFNNETYSLGNKEKQFEGCVCVPAAANRVIIKSLIVSAAAPGGSGKLNTGTSTIVLHGSRRRRVSFHCQPLLLFCFGLVFFFFAPQFPTIQTGRRAAESGCPALCRRLSAPCRERGSQIDWHVVYFRRFEGESGWPLFAPPLLAAEADIGGTLSDLRLTADQTWTVAARGGRRPPLA